MNAPLGYYVHHHGDGHLQRALLIAEALENRVVLLGTGLRGRTGGLAFVELADDRRDAPSAFSDEDRGQEPPPGLHYAPIDHDGVRSRTAAITSWIAQKRPALVVVDVSVEVAMLARLTSTPTVYVRLCGDRSDRPHLDAFAGAQKLMAPFHQNLDQPSLPDWVHQKTFFAPGLARRAPYAGAENSSILVILSGGGAIASEAELLAAAKATPSLKWTVIGGIERRQPPVDNMAFLGWVDDPQTYMSRASVVVGAAGDGVVNGVLAANRPFICFPQSRPYNEQAFKAARLQEMNCAVVVHKWPKPQLWSELVGQALDQPSKVRGALDDENGVARTADWLLTLADQPSSGSRSPHG